MWTLGGGSFRASGKLTVGTKLSLMNGASVMNSTTGFPQRPHRPRLTFGGGRYFLNVTGHEGAIETAPAQNAVTSE